jgi:accessory gene regulator B
MAAYLAAQHELPAEKQDIIRFAIETLTVNIGNLILTLVIGGLLGVFKETLACIITVGAFRHTAGGAHSKSPWRCLVGTMVVFPSLGLLARKISIIQPGYAELLAMVVIIIGFISIILLAPVDTPAAPILSPFRRERLKVFAISTMVLVTVLIISLNKSTWNSASEIQMCLVLSTLWASFNLTKPGHSLWESIDALGFSRKKEVK